MATGPIRVVLVNDFPVVVAGLRSMLAAFHSRVLIVGTAVGVPEPTRADIALLDTFGAEDISRRVQEVLESDVAAGLVVFSWASTIAEKDAAARAGALGFISKRHYPEDIVAAIECIAARLPGPAAGLRPVEHSRSLAVDWPGKAEGLLEREAEVLALIARGLRNEEIARVLYLSVNSIKKYIRSSYAKIGARSRTEALLWALDHGFSRVEQT